MKVEIACTNCGASFAADSTKISEAGVRVRCATCKETFLARLPARSGTADGARPGHQATGQRASKPKASPAESARPQRNPDQRFGGGNVLGFPGARAATSTATRSPPSWTTSQPPGTARALSPSGEGSAVGRRSSCFWR